MTKKIAVSKETKKQVIKSIFSGQMTYKEASIKFNIPQSTIRVWAHYMREDRESPISQKRLKGVGVNAVKEKEENGAVTKEEKPLAKTVQQELITAPEMLNKQDSRLSSTLKSAINNSLTLSMQAVEHLEGDIPSVFINIIKSIMDSIDKLQEELRTGHTYEPVFRNGSFESLPKRLTIKDRIDATKLLSSLIEELSKVLMLPYGKIDPNIFLKDPLDQVSSSNNIHLHTYGKAEDKPILDISEDNNQHGLATWQQKFFN